MSVRPGGAAELPREVVCSPPPRRSCDCCGRPIDATRCGPCLQIHGYPSRPKVVELRRGQS